MQSYLIILLVFLFSDSVQSQKWPGNYTADSSCSTTFCCCVSGQIVVATVASGSAIASGSTSFTTGLSGGLLCAFTSSYATTMTTPAGYVAQLIIGPVTLTFTLNPNNVNIDVTSTQGSSCRSTLTKIATAGKNPTSSGLINIIPPSKTGLLSVMTFLGLIRSIWSI